MSYLNPYLDACVWIAAICGPPAASQEDTQTAIAILTGAEAQGMKIVASTVLHAEIVRGPGEQDDESDRRIDRFLQRSLI